MDSVSSILPKILRKRGLSSQATASLVVFRAQKWLEEHLPRYNGAFAVTDLSHAILRISCGNSIVAQECRSLLQELRDFLVEECPGLVLEDISLSRER